MLRYAIPSLQLLLLIAAGVAGYAARDPGAAAAWPSPLVAALAAAALSVVLAALVWRRRGPGRLAAMLLAAAALVLALGPEGRFQLDRWRVLSAPPEEIAALGAHVILGYRRPSDILPLLERGGIAGIFISTRNVQGRSEAEIAGEIAMLQAVQRRHGRAPLWVAADQEGGLVSRLSPPLPPQRPLRAFASKSGAERAAALAAYARAKAEGLARLGVNLNFAPVVDLDFSVDDPSDRHTRITERAIGRDPEAVAEIAGSYCGHLAAAGIRCTLKHFPGLGRVRGDTHVDGADLAASVAELDDADWIPFRRLAASRAAPAIMLAHVRLPELDPELPASLSKRVADGLLRRTLGHDGLVVTDDLCMGAIYFGTPGLRASGVAALNAGVDLLLVSWDGAQYYKVMSALLRARRSGRLDAAMLAASRARLARHAPAGPR